MEHVAEKDISSRVAGLMDILKCKLAEGGIHLNENGRGCLFTVYGDTYPYRRHMLFVPDGKNEELPFFIRDEIWELVEKKLRFTSHFKAVLEQLYRLASQEGIKLSMRYRCYSRWCATSRWYKKPQIIDVGWDVDYGFPGGTYKRKPSKTLMRVDVMYQKET